MSWRPLRPVGPPAYERPFVSLSVNVKVNRGDRRPAVVIRLSDRAMSAIGTALGAKAAREAFGLPVGHLQDRSAA